MESLEFARARLRGLRDEIRRLKESEFPCSESRDALDILEQLFSSKLDRLDHFDDKSDPQTVTRECAASLHSLFTYLPLLGMVLRSTNVRNAFEILNPLQRVARAILEPGVAGPWKTKLLLSSEWEYSPLTYRSVPELPGFVFIGLPASESSNPFLLPLSGHELGHAVWSSMDLGRANLPSITRFIVDAIISDWARYNSLFPEFSGKPADIESDLFAVQSWGIAVGWAVRQIEETFCDFLGLALFRESYFHAFSFLLSPSTGAPRTVFYPPIQTRIRNLLSAAGSYGVVVPPKYDKLFLDDANPTLGRNNTARLELADAATMARVPEMARLAKDIVSQSLLPLPTSTEQERIIRRFRVVVPAEGCKTLIDIVNAAWLCYLDTELWKDIPQVHARRVEILKELVLKNIEVFDIERRLEESN